MCTPFAGIVSWATKRLQKSISERKEPDELGDHWVEKCKLVEGLCVNTMPWIHAVIWEGIGHKAPWYIHATLNTWSHLHISDILCFLLTTSSSPHYMIQAENQIQKIAAVMFAREKCNKLVGWAARKQHIFLILFASSQNVFRNWFRRPHCAAGGFACRPHTRWYENNVCWSEIIKWQRGLICNRSISSNKSSNVNTKLKRRTHLLRIQCLLLHCVSL